MAAATQALTGVGLRWGQLWYIAEDLGKPCVHGIYMSLPWIQSVQLKPQAY